MQENNPIENPIGLYRHPESGQYIGAIDENQAAAYVRVGFSLYKEGREAAMSTQEELDALTPGPAHRNESTAAANDLSLLSREELNKTAAAIGVDEPETLPNKQAVIEAINEKGA